MKSTILWALIGLNAVLLVCFINGRMGSNLAVAQSRRPADYLLIPGDISGGAVGVVYVIDMSNGLLSAWAYDDAAKQLSSMPPIDLNRVFNLETGAGPAGARPRTR